MTRILFVGQKPETVDFSDPALPPGFDAAKINAGIAVAMAKIAERGWQGDQCMISPDDTAWPMLEKQLRAATYDCVVIGGGLPGRKADIARTAMAAMGHEEAVAEYLCSKGEGGPRASKSRSPRIAKMTRGARYSKLRSPR